MQVKFCSFGKVERQEYDDEAKGGAATFQIEVGRWKGVVREGIVCKECNSGKVKDVCHWMLCCAEWDIVRQPLMEEVSQCHGFQGQCLKKQSAFVLPYAL